MFNLNIPPSSLLGCEGSTLCSTPKTPEIVNSLIAMTNPLDNIHYTTSSNILSSYPSQCPAVKKDSLLISQDSSQSSFSASPLQSPAGINTTPSVQQTCSQLIKAGLKLSIQSKRKISSCESSSGNEQPNNKYRRIEDDCDETTDEEIESKILPKGLTPEDEDRRRRRRERNKIAATKCRMKKRERTNNLIKESEQLDTQNVDLKSQVRSLELERRKLYDMLQSHRVNCGHENRLNMLLKFQQSPAAKYFEELDLDDTKNRVFQKENSLNSQNAINRNLHRSIIPPMSSIKFSQKTGLKEKETAMNLGLSNSNNTSQDYHVLSNSIIPLEPIATGYCKASPQAQDINFFHSSTHESGNSHVTIKLDSVGKHSSNVGDQLSETVISCEKVVEISTDEANKNLQGQPSPHLMNSIENEITMIQSTTDFVKNELVESQSPYTTAQSAERFLFENNCESFIDIKQAMHSNCISNESSIVNNGNPLEFNSPAIGPSSLPASFNDSLSLKSDFLHEADLLAQLTGDGAEFVDLDSSVASVFLSNGGCLA